MYYNKKAAEESFRRFLFILFRIVSVEHFEDKGFYFLFRKAFLNALDFLKEQPVSEKASQCSEKDTGNNKAPVCFKKKKHKGKKNNAGKNSVKRHKPVFHGNNAAGYGTKHWERAPFKNNKAKKLCGFFIEKEGYTYSENKKAKKYRRGFGGGF